MALNPHFKRWQDTTCKTSYAKFCWRK